MLMESDTVSRFQRVQRVSCQKSDPTSRFIRIYHCRENEVKLYGFASQDDLTVFETSLVVKGVGPSLALNIVSKLSPPDFQRAIREADHATLMRVPRLNKELAQLMIMKLKNTVRKIHFDAKVDETGSQEHTEAGVQVLVGLGASESAAERAIADAQKILDLKQSGKSWFDWLLLE